MAWRALPVLEHAAEILGAPSGYTKTGYLVGVGPREPRRAARQRGHAAARSASRSSWWATRRRTRCGPPPGSTTSPSSPTSPTAATATATRRRWPSLSRPAAAARACASTAACRRSDVTADRVSGVVLDGRRPHRCRPRRPGGRAVVRPLWPPPSGIDLPVRAQRAQILLVDPGRPLGPVPVFSDLVSLQYVRTEGTGQILLGDSDHSDPEWADPDYYRERVNDDELADADPQVRSPLPRLRRGLARLLLCRLLRRHARLQPGHLGRTVDGLWLCTGFSGHGYKISPSVGRADGRPHHDGAQPPPRHRSPRLPLGAFRRGGPARQPPPLRGGGPDALRCHMSAA